MIIIWCVLRKLEKSYDRIKNIIYTCVHIIGNPCTSRMNSSIRKFSIVKAFSIDCNPKKATVVVQVISETLECG